MRIFRLRLSLLTTVLTLFAVGALPAAGQPASDAKPGANETQWSLGLGVISSPRPYVGAKNSTQVIPVLDLDSERFYFRGIFAGYRLVEGELFGLDLIGRGQFAGYEEEDSPFLEGMAEREKTLEAGLAATWKIGAFEIEASTVADTLGRSDGIHAGLDLKWGKVFGRGKSGVFPSVGVVWENADFVDYYAGVRPGEARPGRPIYEGRSAVNLSASLNGFVRLTERVRVVALVSGERLDDAYEESPIIDSRWGRFGLLALVYEF